jgi:hypothetical protein
MSDQTAQWRKIIERKTIVKKAFYIRAEKTNWYPEGILKLYRRTRAQNAFTYQAVRIRNPEEFAQVKLTLDWLAGKLNWQELPSILEDLKKQLEKEQEVSPEILRLIQQYPSFATSIVKTFDKVYHGHIEVEDMPTINRFIETTFSSLTGQAKNILENKIELINKLNAETKPEEIQKLTSLLEMYSLPQLTSVTNIITDRLQKIRLLEATIQNERAYEFKGKDSVYNQLINALWILDDAYWLLSSNEPLKKLLDTKSNLPQEDAGLKPDFIFANDKHTLVIVEVKRPSHEVTQKDINQLQNYLVAVDDYAPDFTSKQGFLIAKSISPHYQKIVNETTQLIKAESYVQLIDECKRRYQEYLEAIEKS